MLLRLILTCHNIFQHISSGEWKGFSNSSKGQSHNSPYEKANGKWQTSICRVNTASREDGGRFDYSTEVVFLLGFATGDPTGDTGMCPPGNSIKHLGMVTRLCH